QRSVENAHARDVQLPERMDGQRVEVIPRVDAQARCADAGVRDVEQEAAAAALDELVKRGGLDAGPQQVRPLAAVDEVLDYHRLRSEGSKGGFEVGEQRLDDGPDGDVGDVPDREAG